MTDHFICSCVLGHLLFFVISLSGSSGRVSVDDQTMKEFMGTHQKIVISGWEKQASR